MRKCGIYAANHTLWASSIAGTKSYINSNSHKRQERDRHMDILNNMYNLIFTVKTSYAPKSPLLRSVRTEREIAVFCPIIWKEKKINPVIRLCAKCANACNICVECMTNACECMRKCKMYVQLRG